jgi:uncharacterized repeat protein (TIGR02543 family)
MTGSHRRLAVFGLVLAGLASACNLLQKEEISYDLNVLCSPPVGGSVSRSPVMAEYPEGTAVTLTAVPASGYAFTGWSGGAAGASASTAVTMDADRVVLAGFAPVAPTQRGLTIIASPPGKGSVTVSPSGTIFAAGTAISLTPVPAAGYAFVGWSGDLAGSASPANLAMSADRLVWAEFAPLPADWYELWTDAQPSAGGSVTVAAPGALSGPSYPPGTELTLTPVPAAGYAFTGWTGDASGAANPLALTLDGNHWVAAQFRLLSGGGSIQTAPLDLAPTVETVAGSYNISGGVNGLGSGALFSTPLGQVVVGGYLYIADRDNHRIRRLDLATNRVATFSGLGSPGHRDDVAANALFSSPFGLASDGSYLYVSETGNHDIRRVSLADGSVATIAGIPGSPAAADNADGTLAQFNYPTALVYVAGAPNYLYVCDHSNQAIRRVDLTDAAHPVTTIAGNLGSGPSYADSDGSGVGEAFYNPHGLAGDATALWVSSGYEHAIRRVDLASGVVATVAGAYGGQSYNDSVGTAARFNTPYYLALSPDGAKLYISEHGNDDIRVMATTAPYEVTTLTGSGSGYADGGQTAARFADPSSLCAAGNYLYVSDQGNHAIRRIDLATRQTVTLAGAPGVAGFADGLGAGALLGYPHGMATDGTYVYFTDPGVHVVRKYEIATGRVSALAGINGNGSCVDGVGASATFYNPYGITLAGGLLYVADHSNQVIRRIDPANGAVSTFAGWPGGVGNEDGVGNAARFNGPVGITSDGASLYVTCIGAHTVRKIDIATRRVVTLAGVSGQPGSADGGGSAGPMNSAARFNTPYGIATDGRMLYVADQANNVIRSVDPVSGETRLLAGKKGLAGGGDATGENATFRSPAHLTCDGTALYVTDSAAHTVRRIDLATAAVTTVAGADNVAGYAEGAGGDARFNTPLGLTTDGISLYVADAANRLIRRVF